MSLPFQLTKQSIFDSRRTPNSRDSELCSSLMISSSTVPSLRSESREKCARFLVPKDMNAQSQPQLVTKLTINEDYSNDKKDNTDSKDPFSNHQFAFKLIKKSFTKSRDSGLRKTKCVRGLQTLENVALARRLRQSIEEQQQDSKIQTSQTQKENDYSFFQSIDKKRPVTKHHFRIKSPDYGTRFDDKQSQTTTNILRNSTMESFYSPKGSRIEVKAPVERESTILSVKRLVDTEFKDIEGSDVQTAKQKRLNAAQNKMSKLMLRISSAATTSCKNIESNVQSIGSVESLNLNGDILKMQSSVKNQDTSVHLKRAMTPSANTKSRLVLKNRPDTSLDRLAGKRVKPFYKVKQAERSSKDSISCGRETTDQTPSVTKVDQISSRIFVYEGMDKKPCVSSSVQEIPSLNTSLHFKNKTKRTTREKSKEFEILSESVNLKNDPASTEEFAKDEVIEGDQDDQEMEDKVEVDEEAREREFRARLLGPSAYQREDPNAHYKVAIQQKNVMRASSAKQDYFKNKIPEECLQAKAEISQLAKKVINIQQEKEISKSTSKRSMDFVSGTSCTLNELEIGFVKEEYAKKAQGNRSIDYDQIDNLVSRLKYFSRLPKDVRMGLLRNGSYAYYPFGSTIFNQGDYGDQMYVILRGSVNVRVTKKASFGMLENTIIDTLYDGMHFGEYTITAVPQQPDTKKDEIQESVKVKNLNRLKTFGFGEQSAGLEEINRTQEVSFSYQKDLSLKEIKTQEALKLSQRSYEDNKPRRMATVEAAESCDILCIPRDKFQDVFLNLVKKELDDKVKALSELSFFKKVDQVDLVPLANNLTMRVYKMDEVIQAVDQPVEKFRIIAKGRCQLVVGVTKKSEVPLAKTLKNRVASAKRFHTGLSDHTNKGTQIRTNTIQCFGVKQEIAPVQKISNRAFTFEQVGTEGDQIVYVEHVPFATLTRGNFIGARALLTENDFQNEHTYFQSRFRLNKPAKVSMVADTPTVEVLEIEKHHLKYIPESLLKILKQGLMTAKEFDDFNIEREIRQNQEWDDYKAAQVAQIMKSKTPTYRTGFKVC